ncbi:rod shape-determining protein [Alicyclobacillus cycloheptanicus]|uniref:Cell shape-determining protein MreB n=1 Tax=Alicyclobacillus cycloheptanicus TaxID=1457 RepID=A0ABT9XIW8_9BACL|nr:rod shape-determining protein [Alicyclobacillus cycloheptanicus]MDQ0190253.1 rod shape-determining protein MreB [Alicyclobacillus cycloheptanicus]
MDIALDLGTSRFRVGVLGSDNMCSEPSTVAYDQSGRQLVGDQAEQLIGRAPQGMTAIHPILSGVVKDFEAAVALIRYAFSQALQGRMPRRPNVTVSIPTGITAVEKRAVEEAVREAGGKQVQLFESVIAAAIGAGLPFDSPHGALILNLGAGVTEAAVISLGGIVDCRKISMGGRNLDEAIVESVRKEHAFLIGLKTAEALKCSCGEDSSAVLTVRGRNLATGLPDTLEVSRALIESQVASYCESVVGLLVSALESSPPELVGDFMDSGIVITGGGSRLHGLLSRLRQKTDMPIVVADDADTCVIRGLLSAVPQRESRIAALRLRGRARSSDRPRSAGATGGSATGGSATGGSATLQRFASRIRRTLEE